MTCSHLTKTYKMKMKMYRAEWYGPTFTGVISGKIIWWVDLHNPGDLYVYSKDSRARFLYSYPTLEIATVRKNSSFRWDDKKTYTINTLEDAEKKLLQFVKEHNIELYGRHFVDEVSVQEEIFVVP